MFKGFDPVFIALCIVAVLVMAGLGLVGPVLPLYGETFGVNTATLGFLITGFGLARMAMDLPAGVLCETWGRRRVMLAGTGLLALGSLLAGLADDFWLLVAWRALQGVGSAMYTTAAMTLVADNSTKANRGRAMALYQGGLLLGAGLGPTIGGFIAEYWGYQAPFFFFAVLCLGATWWIWLKVPREPSGNPGNQVVVITPVPDDAAARRAARRHLLHDRDFWLVSLVTLGVFFSRAGAQNDIIPLAGARLLGLTQSEVGLGVTAIFVGNLVTLLVAGQIADKWGRKAAIVPSSIVAAVSLLFLGQAANFWWFCFFGAWFGAGIGIGGPAPAAYLTDIAPKEAYGVAMGLMRMVGDVGFVLGPLVMGWLVDTVGFGGSLGFNALLLGVAALLFGLLAKEKRPSGRQLSVYPVASKDVPPGNQRG